MTSDEYDKLRARLSEKLKGKSTVDPRTGALGARECDVLDQMLPDGYRVDRDHNVLATGTIKTVPPIVVDISEGPVEG